MINISVINESTVYSEAEALATMHALQSQWNKNLAPVWHLDQATFSYLGKGNTPPAGAWWVIFLDDSDQAGALAYHDVTNDGFPLSKVFVKTILADNSSVSVGASHECCEMAVDPTINLAAQDTSGVFWAYEVCDPVEDDQYGYEIGDVLVSDFVTPAWFGFASSSGKALDRQGHVTAAFEVLSGGYAQNNNGGGWQQVTGKHAAMVRRVMYPSKGSRRERRIRMFRDGIVRSAHKF
jgi:hypothetical protein